MSFFAERPRASYLRQWHLEMRTATDDYELKVLDLIAQHLPVPIAILGMTLEDLPPPGVIRTSFASPLLPLVGDQDREVVCILVGRLRSFARGLPLVRCRL